MESVAYDTEICRVLYSKTSQITFFERFSKNLFANLCLLLKQRSIDTAGWSGFLIKNCFCFWSDINKYHFKAEKTNLLKKSFLAFLYINLNLDISKRDFGRFQQSAACRCEIRQFFLSLNL